MGNNISRRILRMVLGNKTYKEVRNNFSPEAKARITDGADKIREELKILRTLREVVGISQEELAKRLDVKQPYISQLEGRANMTLNTLVGVVAALGGSVDIIAVDTSIRTFVTIVETLHATSLHK